MPVSRWGMLTSQPDPDGSGCVLSRGTQTWFSFCLAVVRGSMYVFETLSLLIFTLVEQFSRYWRGNGRKDGWADKLRSSKIQLPLEIKVLTEESEQSRLVRHLLLIVHKRLQWEPSPICRSRTCLCAFLQVSHLLTAIITAFVRHVKPEQHIAHAFQGLLPLMKAPGKPCGYCTENCSLCVKSCVKVLCTPFPWGLSFWHCLVDQHQLSSLAMLKQGGFRCAYRVLRFLGRPALLGSLAVEHLELNSRMQAFSRNHLWGLTDFSGQEECKAWAYWDLKGAASGLLTK